MTTTPPKLPSWFYLGRAIVSLALGLAVIWQEATGAGRVLVLLAGILLTGLYAPADIVAWRRGGGAADTTRSDG